MAKNTEYGHGSVSRDAGHLHEHLRKGASSETAKDAQDSQVSRTGNDDHLQQSWPSSGAELEDRLETFVPKNRMAEVLDNFSDDLDDLAAMPFEQMRTIVLQFLTAGTNASGGRGGSKLAAALHIDHRHSLARDAAGFGELNCCGAASDCSLKFVWKTVQSGRSSLSPGTAKKGWKRSLGNDLAATG
jgi:hypothetical protein